jgi:hypothetical protein
VSESVDGASENSERPDAPVHGRHRRPATDAETTQIIGVEEVLAGAVVHRGTTGCGVTGRHPGTVPATG